MQIQKNIEEKISAELNPEILEIINESDQHSGPKGRETHFHITVVSKVFDGLNRIKRHQKIYAILADWMQNPIHALSLHTFTPAEWQERGGQVNASPDCAAKN